MPGDRSNHQQSLTFNFGQPANIPQQPRPPDLVACMDLVHGVLNTRKGRTSNLGNPTRDRAGRLYGPSAWCAKHQERYSIELEHAGFKWTIRRRYKHFLKLDAELFLMRVDPRQHIIPASRGHHNLPSRHLPRRPDPFATTTNMDSRIEKLEKYLQVILDNEDYRNHKETLNFLEISDLSFKYDLGDKGRKYERHKGRSRPESLSDSYVTRARWRVKLNTSSKSNCSSSYEAEETVRLREEEHLGQMDFQVLVLSVSQLLVNAANLYTKSVYGEVNKLYCERYEVGFVAKHDELIIQMGNCLCDQHGERQATYISTKMREIARLVLEVSSKSLASVGERKYNKINILPLAEGLAMLRAYLDKTPQTRK
ncbi:predicted protein [Nematostella vectensis]|uniref:PX domain-containing protein n=1 Tax=Nematostella vectensis TaxID=45351 RepID=A7SEZ0_NEMVE|nr:predicted protein [Nematostella vectensis]|eukprot:XP_001629803.1 predicted protein [Nematostella vectensis]